MRVCACVSVGWLRVCGCIVTHITAPDVQFALQPRLNRGTDRQREQEDVGAVASWREKEARHLGWAQEQWTVIQFLKEK